MLRLPLIIYVSGAPGAGKTTLASKLANYLYIPHISSDLIHGGVLYTNAIVSDRKNTIHNTFVPLLNSYAQSGISIVVDQVLQKNLSEDDIINKIKPNAYIINIHLITDNPIDRHITRELQRKDLGVYQTSSELKDRAKYHENNLINTSEPLVLNMPQLTVLTNDGYNPNFEEIVTFIEKTYKEYTNEKTN